MDSSDAANGRSGQAAAEAIQANVTIVMAGILPEEQPHAIVTTEAHADSDSLSEGDDDTTPPAPITQHAFPAVTTQVANFLQSVVSFVGDGCGIVDDVQYRQRMEICRPCDRRIGERCTACGCWLPMKARGRTFSCPIGRWE